MDSATANINKLVSLTFDEDPEVRKKVAKSLSEIKDPGAVFALMELRFDKNPEVREMAERYLEKKKKSEPDLMSFASIFSNGAKKEKKEEEKGMSAKEKMLRPITLIFEKRLGKERAEIAKSKLMPAIEKVYAKAQQHKNKSGDNGRKVMQEFLTDYLEVMSDLDSIGGEGAAHPQIEVHEEGPEAPEIPREEPVEEIVGELEEIGKSAAENDKLSAEAASLELQQIEEIKEREEIKELPDTFFKKAYEIMMLSEGDEVLMKQQMDRMIDDARKEIGLAFRMAKKRFKEMNITNITDIKDGMRNINTDLLSVRLVENMEYQKTKKTKAIATRIVINDAEGNEGVVYLFDDRGSNIKKGMQIKIVKGMAKSFAFEQVTG